MSDCTRRGFIGSVVGAAACGKMGCADRDPGVIEKKKKASVSKAHPEEAKPPLLIERDDALRSIARIKAPEAELIDVSGENPGKMTRMGLEAIGGMRHFVGKGDRVVISPNFAWAKPPGAGVTTTPQIVQELILMCFEAGARDVVCLDYATDMTPRAYRVNKAHDALKDTRARLLSPWSAEQYVRIRDFERGDLHRKKLGWQAVPAVLLRCDALISVPIFKHHRQTGITGALKKQMGCIWRREAYHRAGLDVCIAELGSVLRPTLVVTDAIRVLCSNGPNGPGKICEPGRILVSTDPVLADAHACLLLNKKPETIKHLVHAAKLGAGKLNLSPDRIEKVGVKG